MELKEIYEKSSELSLDAALGVIGNEELLKEVAGQFGEHMDENVDSIEKHLFDRDYKNFTIKVHSLKSSAKMIGAERLSALARELEELGKKAQNGDRESEKQILRIVVETLERYLRVGISLSPLIIKKEVTEKKDLPEGFLEKFYSSAAAFTEDFDSDGIEGLLNEADGYSLPEEDAARVEDLRKAYDEADWDKMAEIAGNY